MKNKNFSLFSYGFAKCLGLLCLGLLALTACEKGFDSGESFESDVRNAQLVSPELSKACFSKVMSSSGEEQVKVAWQVVSGAGGYACQVMNVDDPSAPYEVYSDTIDGTSFVFPSADDTKYSVSVRTLGNQKYNNTEAQSATVYDYSTMVEGQVIPAGTEISAFVKANLKETTDEQAFELEPGASYELNDEVDFQDKVVTFRGDKIHHAFVTLGENGVIRTSTGLKVQWINFDCAQQKCSKTGITGVVEMSRQPAASASAEAQGVGAGKNGGKPADVFVCTKTIMIKECAFKDVHCCLFSVGQGSWGISDIRVNGCVVQLDNDGSAWGDASVISAYSPTWLAPSGGNFWYGGIKDVTVTNSTFLNIKPKAGNNRFIRFNNKDLDRVFPTPAGSGKIENCTFYQIMTNKEFGNNTPSKADYVITFNNNLLVDAFRLQKYIQGGCTLHIDPATNILKGVLTTVDGTDKTRCGTEDPSLDFVGPCDVSLDFSQPLFGLNFQPTNSSYADFGDPRWK